MHEHGRKGFTMIEMAVVLAIIGVVVAITVPVTSQWAQNQRLTATARLLSGAFDLARSEAIRTGNVHAVFIETDADTNPLSVSALVLDDGRIGTTGQNCQIDTGEPTTEFTLENGVSFGVTNATAKVATDPGGGSLGTASFLDADGNGAQWVLFRPEGMPLAFSSDCDTGAVGTGGGAVYLTNGERDAAVVLTPLGATRTHAWNASTEVWTQ